MRKAMPLIILIILAIVTIVINRYNETGPSSATSSTSSAGGNATSSNASTTRGLNRNPSHISYSKHAKCRMACRHIDESEIKKILKEGKINYSKSDLKAAECKKRYAVEGVTRDRQRIRIIVAPCQTEVTVITVIDLEKDWTCDCD